MYIKNEEICHDNDEDYDEKKMMKKKKKANT